MTNEAQPSAKKRTRKPGALPADRLSATLALDAPTTSIPGVSATRAAELGRLGMRTVRDVVMHYPRRYMDLTNLRTTATARIGEQCTVCGEVHEVKLKKPRYNLPIVEITLVDSHGTMIASFFHQPWLKKQVKLGDRMVVSGKAEFNYGFLRMTNPFMEMVDETPSEGRIIPMHPASGKLPAATLRRIVESACAIVRGMYDPLPSELRTQRGVVGRGEAVQSIHFPKEMGEVQEARRRLVYEELLFLQLYLMLEGRSRSEGLVATAHTTDGPKVAALAASLPFELTSEQKGAVEELLASLSSPDVSDRMLLGDVGTGKTVVAAFGFAAAADTGSQGMLLAPTEVLAMQHKRTLGALFDNAGISHALLTGSTKPAERKAILGSYADGELDVLIGTHALLEDDVAARNLTFVAIDEQQRFGVNQRAKALSKGEAPDALFMTATPIPRTLALALFGNLELSYLHERPNVEARRETKVLRSSDKGVAFDAALEELEQGRQAYVVCPLIGVDAEAREEASANKKTAQDRNDAYHPSVAIENEADFSHDNLVAAKEEAEFLQSRVFPGYNVGLLHGGMPSDEKAGVMSRFREGAIDVLVSTTVIEVGVDVPNATVMIVEDADRFGLSQLHQLRGRVGRGSADAKVFLISASMQEEALRRLAALESSDDGFEIAQYDLSLRREGDILGNRQSGASALKLVNVVRDAEVIEQAHEDARAILAADPDLSLPQNVAIAREVKAMFRGEHSVIGG